MTQTQTTHHATRAAFVAQIANLAAQGYQFDASNVSDNNNCTFQPYVIAYKGADTIYVRFNAMADGTHHLRRADAFTAAAAIITAAQSAAEQSAQQPVAIADTPAQRPQSAAQSAPTTASAPSSPATLNAPAPLQTHKR